VIANITRGSSAKGLANYLHGQGRANEHVYDGKVGGAQIGGTLGNPGDRTGRDWSQEMTQVIDQRPKVSDPVWHMSLRAAPGDRVLSDTAWRDIAQSMGEQMGWDARPWVVVRHAPDHVHIVVSRVNWDGSLWQARHDYRAAQQARVQVEREFKLTSAPTRSLAALPAHARVPAQAPAHEHAIARATAKGPAHEVALTPAEHAKALRTATPPARTELANRVRAAAEGCTGLGRDRFEQALMRCGVEARANVASTGRVSGYSFRLVEHHNGAGEPVWFKASQLDRTLSWSSLGPRLGAPLPAVAVEVAPRRLLETKGRFAERSAQAHAAAVAANLAQRFRIALEVVRYSPFSTVLAEHWRGLAERSERRVVPELVAQRRAQGDPVRRGGRPLREVVPTAEQTVAALAARMFPRESMFAHPVGTSTRPTRASQPGTLEERAARKASEREDEQWQHLERHRKARERSLGRGHDQGYSR